LKKQGLLARAKQEYCSLSILSPEAPLFSDISPFILFQRYSASFLSCLVAKPLETFTKSYYSYQTSFDGPSQAGKNFHSAEALAVGQKAPLDNELKLQI
jgi:hypothetical protein